MKKFSMQITNEVILNTDGLTVFEVKNDIGCQGYPTYDYYLFMPNYTMVESFGVMQKDRFSTVSLIRLYENGYFDSTIEESFN